MKDETLIKYNHGEKLYNEGKSLQEIAKTLKISKTRFRTWLKNKGYQTGYDCLPVYKLGMKMYLSKKEISTVKIASELRISRKRFTSWMKSQGVIITNSSKKYTCNENYFENIDSEDKAYWLGFIFADGCVLENKNSDKKIKSLRLEISLQYADKEQLHKFNNSIKSDYKITKRTVKIKNKKFECCRLIISSTKLCRDLIKLGCVPRKSLTAKFPKSLPDDLVRHFVRGYVDGDGSVMLATSKKHARLSILGTKEFLEELQIKMKWKHRTISCNGANGKAYSVEYAGTYALDYLRNLYGNANVYLDRKYKKYNEIIAVLTQTLQKS